MSAATTSAPSRRRPGTPTLRFERELLRQGHRTLACMDEVGRGALAGPVTLGVVVITEQTPTAPRGVRDSKLLTAAHREQLVGKVRRWAVDAAVGHASAEEIDRWGIVPAMRLAGHRALEQLRELPDLVLLDGNHDYLTPPAQAGLFDDGPAQLEVVPAVVTAVKADLRCAGVAAASILAKTARDELMRTYAAELPEYGWAENKGYAAPEHIDALTRLGPCVLHRRSWSLPGTTGAVDGGIRDDRVAR